MKLIERKNYLEKIVNTIGTPDIKVITGIRRCGKSKLMNAFKEYIENNIENSNVIHIDFNLAENDKLLTHKALFEFVNAHYDSKKQNFLLIDEVQMCDNFEKAINWLHASEKYDIYITGSNAFLLSSDLATLFTGRTFEISVFPFSFCEYVRYFEPQNIYDAFDCYVREGGMAGSYLYKTEEDKYDYIENVLKTLIIRDIRQKYKIRKPELLNSLTDYLMDNVGNLLSVPNVASKLKTTTNTTINSYISYLKNAFAFYEIKRYDVRGKDILTANSKYYLCDHSFRYAKLGTKNMDFGRIYENIVAMELLRRGFEVYVGVLYKKEIDFVAINRNKKLYIQVSDDISNKKTFEREVSPLLQIRDAYPKILLARTHREEYQYEGIRIIDIANWLML